MKTKESVKNKNFTKLTQKGGISLIVLVITIIVIIILAAAVILTINNNNPVAEANKARYESDRANMQAVFTNVVAKVMTHNRATVSVTAGQVNTVTSGVNQTTGEVSYIVTDAENSANASGKVVFDKGDSTNTVFYTGKKLPIYAAGETKWYVDSEGVISLEVAGVKYGEGEIAEPPFSQIVANNVSTYYGAKVTNYKTGNTTIDNQVEWQIFYADTSNIYLIATDYVHYDLLPKITVKNDANEDVVYELTKYTDYRAYWDDDILGLYKGSEDITDIRLQALNKSYYEYLTTNNTISKNDNIKAVAYMMDIGIWNTFAGDKADYAIGGPTVEMLFNSYNQKYSANGVDYRAKVTSVKGYQISKDGGNTWADSYARILNSNDSQYVIKNDDKASNMYLSSPSAGDTDGIMRVNDTGYVYMNSHDTVYGGFRPIVCLNSNVTLKAVGETFEIE